MARESGVGIVVSNRGSGMRDGLRISGDVGDELDEDNKGAEHKEDEPEQAQAKDSQGQYSGGLAGAIRERPLA